MPHTCLAWLPACSPGSYMQVYEILDNAIDEVQSGYAHTVKVCLRFHRNQHLNLEFSGGEGMLMCTWILTGGDGPLQRLGNNFGRWAGHPHQYTPTDRTVCFGDCLDSAARWREVWRAGERIQCVWGAPWCGDFSGQCPLRAAPCHGLVGCCLYPLNCCSSCYTEDFLVVWKEHN